MFLVIKGKEKPSDFPQEPVDNSQKPKSSSNTNTGETDTSSTFLPPITGK